MASTASYGLKALVTAMRTCFLPGCVCSSDKELMRKNVNSQLGPSHQLTQADYDAISVDLDQDPISDRPAASGTDVKRRDNGEFDGVVKQAFDAFKFQERQIILDAPPGIESADGANRVHSDNSTRGRWWLGAAHLRHYLEFLVVLKGVRPCMLFMMFAFSNVTIFSTIVIDCLVPIMNQLNLWSYGFRVSFMSDHWVFYDARASNMPLITKVFLTHGSAKALDRVSYTAGLNFDVPDREFGGALGYPIPLDDIRHGRSVAIRDTTELNVLVSRGWSQGRCCVQGMSFLCPTGEGMSHAALRQVLIFYCKCELAARSVGTQLQLSTWQHPDMTRMLAGTNYLQGPEDFLGSSTPALRAITEAALRVQQPPPSAGQNGRENGARHEDEDGPEQENGSRDGSGGYL